MCTASEMLQEQCGVHRMLTFFSPPFLSLSPQFFVHFLLRIQLTMNDFSVHRIIGRGGFGEVYGCRKADTGKM